MVSDLRLFREFSEPARAQFYRVLGPCLPEPLPAIASHVAQFAREFGIDEGALMRAVRVSRFLVREASAHDMDAEQLRKDLAALGDGGELERSLLPGYAKARVLVRNEIATAVLVAHGRLLEKVDWRTEQITGSNFGEGIQLGIAVVTLSYRDGDRHDRITLQLSKESLEDLRSMCDRLLGPVRSA
jgi:hypothetical protein